MADNRGFTLMEISVAVLLLTIAIVPMVNAYRPAILSIDDAEERAVFTNQARGTLYRISALDFQTLENNQGDPASLAGLLGSSSEAAKESFSWKGETITPTVAITDASGGTGGLLRFSVAIGPVRFTALKADL